MASYNGPLLDGGPYTITQPFGCTSYSGEWASCRGCTYFHAGIDIGTIGGAPAVHALGPGVVVAIGGPHCYSCPTGYCGGPNAVAVRSGAYDFWYFHLGDRVVGVGQPVGAGQVLGHVDSLGCSTGNHLHYQVQPAGVSPDCQHALDPSPFLYGWPGSAPPSPPPPGPLCPDGYSWDGVECVPTPAPTPGPAPPPPPVSTSGGPYRFALLAGGGALLAFGLHGNPVARRAVSRYVHEAEGWVESERKRLVRHGRAATRSSTAVVTQGRAARRAAGFR